MRFGVRLPGPFFATFGRSARGQARRNLQVRAHERDILAGHRTLGEEIDAILSWVIKGFFSLFFVGVILLLPFYIAWVGIAHVANHVDPDLHWHQTYRAVANCNITMGTDAAPVSGYCVDGTYEPIGWHY